MEKWEYKFLRFRFVGNKMGRRVEGTVPRYTTGTLLVIENGVIVAQLAAEFNLIHLNPRDRPNTKNTMLEYPRQVIDHLNKLGAEGWRIVVPDSPYLDVTEIEGFNKAYTLMRQVV
jgi:hypothetical protein